AGLGGARLRSARRGVVTGQAVGIDGVVAGEALDRLGDLLLKARLVALAVVDVAAVVGLVVVTVVCRGLVHRAGGDEDVDLHDVARLSGGGPPRGVHVGAFLLTDGGRLGSDLRNDNGRGGQSGAGQSRGNALVEH